MYSFMFYLLISHESYEYTYFFFFFSSRRRHTRWNCDWSSDVCSSDLVYGDDVPLTAGGAVELANRGAALRRQRDGAGPQMDRLGVQTLWHRGIGGQGH